MTIVKKLKALKVGKSCHIETEGERKHALNAAGILGIRIATRKLVKGGFTVTRLPNDN